MRARFVLPAALPTKDGAMDISQLSWKCSCGQLFPPTTSDFMSLIAKKEHRGHKHALVNRETGEVVAQSPSHAKSKGIILPGAKQEQEPDPAEAVDPVDADLPADNEDEEDDEAGRTLDLKVVADGIFTTEVTLPADAFVLYNIAKATGLEDTDKTFNEWLWDCVQRRFSKDYRMQLVLAPLPEEGP